MPIKIAQIAFIVTLAFAGAAQAETSDSSGDFASKFFAERTLNGN
jgi:hypothetical protein